MLDQGIWITVKLLGEGDNDLRTASRFAR